MVVVGILLFFQIELMVVAAFSHQAFAAGGAFVFATRVAFFVGKGLLAMHANAGLVTIIQFHGHAYLVFGPADVNRLPGNRYNDEWLLRKY